jgi:predicted kinase
MNKLYIIRGAPGSGKSTHAKKLLDCDVMEADSFFIQKDGGYFFNGQLLKRAHDWCQEITRSWLAQALEICDTGFKTDFGVANTFTRVWEMQPYLDMAEKYGYEVVVHRCTGEFENVHGVPLEKVKQMRERMEDYPGEILITGDYRYEWIHRH